LGQGWEGSRGIGSRVGGSGVEHTAVFHPMARMLILVILSVFRE
jgi:hypothetical protein